MRGHRRSRHIAILLFASFASIVCQSTSAVGGTVEEEVLEVLERAAKWQLANVPPMRHWTEWPLAVFLVGLSALSTSVRGSSPIWRKQLLDIASIKNKWQLGARTYHADDQVVAQVYLELYASSDDEYRDKVMIRAIHERFDSILKHPPKSANLTFVGRSKTDNWAWSDSLFMAPPAWIQLWSLTHNEVYRSHAITEFWRTTNFLFDADERLYYRDSNYFPPRKEKNGMKIFWSRGNGWVLAGLARMLERLPENDAARPALVKHFVALAERIKELQSDVSGGWSASLLAPDSCSPEFESSGTAFNCFSFAWGVNHGVLPRDTFAPRAIRAWKALVSKVDNKSGRLSHVQPIGQTPENFPANSSEPFGVGALLLAGAHVRTLLAAIGEVVEVG